MSDADRLAALLPYIRHGATCALQSVRDNAPWDDLCTCGLRETWAAGVTLDPRPVRGDPDLAALRPARRGGKRQLTFATGSYENYESVLVQHSAGEWDRILIARDDGTIADALVAAINGVTLDPEQPIAALPDEQGVREWPGGGGRVTKDALGGPIWTSDPDGAWVVLYAPQQFHSGLRLVAAGVTLARARPVADTTLREALDAEQRRWMQHGDRYTDEEVGSIIDRIRAALEAER